MPSQPVNQDYKWVHIKKKKFLSNTKLFNYFSKAYREVFEYLIEEFRTYKPLLASIKNEYELMLSYQRERIRELEPLRVKKSYFFLFFLTF